MRLAIDTQGVGFAWVRAVELVLLPVDDSGLVVKANVPFKHRHQRWIARVHRSHQRDDRPMQFEAYGALDKSTGAFTHDLLKCAAECADGHGVLDKCLRERDCLATPDDSLQVRLVAKVWRRNSDVIPTVTARFGWLAGSASVARSPTRSRSLAASTVLVSG
jgi:DNA-binding transcriptional LysR family regulator